MGACMDYMESHCSGFGDTEESAVENLANRMAATARNVKINKNYYMVYTNNKITSCNNIKMEKMDGVYYSGTHLYAQPFNNKGMSELEALNNLVEQMKAHCEDAYYISRYTITCNNNEMYTSIKEYNMPVTIRKYGENDFRAFC
jgi:hypothetical protein